MQGTDPNPFAQTKEVCQFGGDDRDDSQKRLKRRRKNQEIDQGDGRARKLDDGTEKTQDLARECMAQMQQMMGMMTKLSQDVQQLGRRLDGIEPKVQQMYERFLLENEEATPVYTPLFGTPPLDLMDEVQTDPIRPLFRGLFFPDRECKLLSSDVEFQTKLKQELKRIEQQATGQQMNEELTTQLKKWNEKTFVSDDVKAKASGFGNAPAYATLKSPRHVNQDCFSWFSMDVNYRQEMCHADFFVVLDGHGPPKEQGYASIYCSENIKDTLAKCMSALNKEGADYTISNAIKITFVLLDSMFKEYMERQYPRKTLPGTTACLAMIVEGQLFIANCGDSRAILNTGSPERTMQLSYDFKASDPHAQKTTTNREGTIKSYKNTLRVNGILAVTRAIGDEFLREKKTLIKPISPRPKIVIVDLKKVVEKPEFASLTLATDGYFDMASSSQAGNGACQLLMRKQRPYDVASIFVQAASNAGSKDDITVGVIPLQKYLRI